MIRINHKRNGDRIVKFLGSGETQTFKPSGTLIKELPSGVVETYRTNGKIYREHPDGNVEVLPMLLTPQTSPMRRMTLSELPSLQSELLKAISNAAREKHSSL